MADFIRHATFLGQLTTSKLQPGTYFFAYSKTDVVKRVVVNEPIDLWQIKKYWTNDMDGVPEVFETNAQANSWIADQLVSKTTTTITLHPAIEEMIRPTTVVGQPMIAVVKTVTDKVMTTVTTAKSKWWFWPAVVLSIAGAGTGAYYGYKKLLK